MAKVVFTSDIHFCKRESLVEDRYEHLVKSLVWADCGVEADLHIDLGDMFNTSHLTAEDVAVLDSVHFRNKWHCVMGNHEQDGHHSLLRYFRDIHEIYEAPRLKRFDGVGWFLFLPFTKHPMPLSELLRGLPDGEKVVVCSHCEFVGMFDTVEGAGYSLDEINADARIKMWFQGHYHQRAVLSPKVVIVGNLCGQNFTQNFDPHGVVVYDTDTNKYTFVENPYALVFGKMDTNTPKCKDIRKLIEGDPVKRYVLAIQTDSELRDKMKAWAAEHLVASRIMVSDVAGAGLADEEVEQFEAVQIDHVALFKEEVAKRFGEDVANEICGA